MKIRRTIVCFALILCITASITLSATAAFDDSTLKWDGEKITLSALAQRLGYDMVDVNGNYKPMYYNFAQQLWEKGLMLGSNGCFDLDKPLTRTEGIIMTLRLLGKEQEALDAKLPCPFQDVPTWARYQVAYAAQKGITSGYSATVFGANDAMTANHYITFVLRVMGYNDAAGEFVWSDAASKAVQIGLIGEPCAEQYKHSTLFLRDNVAIISYSALFGVEAKNGTLLGDQITAKRPEGNVPTASTTAIISATGEANIASISSFNLLANTTIDVDVRCMKSGKVTVTASSGSSSASVTEEMAEGKVYTVRFDVGADVMGSISGGGSISLTTQTITFSTSSGSSRSSSCFGATPTIKSAQIVAVK